MSAQVLSCIVAAAVLGGRNGNDITLAEPPFRPLSHEKCKMDFQAKIALIK